MLTCQDCLATRHNKCRGNNGCACSVCAKIKRSPIPPAESKESFRSIAFSERKVPTRKPRPSNPRVPSTTAKAIYAREYRKRRARGETLREYHKTTPDDLRRIVGLHLEGFNCRQIADELGMDRSYVWRLVKRLMAEGRELESQG